MSFHYYQYSFVVFPKKIKTIVIFIDYIIPSIKFNVVIALIVDLDNVMICIKSMWFGNY